MTKSEAKRVRFVLTDIDDTLTKKGKLTAAAYSALWELREAGLAVVPVTGRPAGWCDCIVREWPVDGVIGENGALAFWEEPADTAAPEPDRLPILKTEYHPSAIRNDHPLLARIREKALSEVPGLRVAKDQFARLFDIALDFAEEEPALPLEAAERARAIAAEAGAMAKISSIHVNIWLGNYDKLSMAYYFLHHRFGEFDKREVVFVGDSPNDAPMFTHFPLACAVANIHRYQGMIKPMPAFVASRECGEGFAEIVETILGKRKG
jgi:HAD superfamily hydrolase (TIGR01484 family)